MEFQHKAYPMIKGSIQPYTMIDVKPMYDKDASTTFHSVIDICYAYLIFEYSCGIYQIKQEDNRIKILSDGMIIFDLILYDGRNINLISFRGQKLEKNLGITEFKNMMLAELNKK